MKKFFASLIVFMVASSVFIKPIYAVAPEIGSIDDPFITKTYFNTNTAVFQQGINGLNTTVSSLQGTVTKNNTDLVAQINDLKAQVATLQQVVTDLSQGKVSDAVMSTQYTFGAITGFNYPLKASPSDTASTVVNMPYYSGVDILGVTASGWYKVKYYNNTGFVPASALKILK